jgi:hypothetical protein
MIRPSERRLTAYRKGQPATAGTTAALLAQDWVPLADGLPTSWSQEQSPEGCAASFAFLDLSAATCNSANRVTRDRPTRGDSADGWGPIGTGSKDQLTGSSAVSWPVVLDSGQSLLGGIADPDPHGCAFAV